MGFKFFKKQYMSKYFLQFSIFLIFNIIATNSLFAIKAYPYPVEITQPDGSKLTVKLNGDEFHHYKTTIDGIQIIKNAKGFQTYANINTEGQLVASDVIAKNPNQRSNSDLQFINSIEKPTLLQKNKIARSKSRIFSAQSKPRRAFPLTGSPKSLVILVNFTDKSFAKSTTTAKTDFANLLNQDNYAANGGTGSARDYFMSSSYGKFAPDFDVVGPYTLPNNMAYYGANDADGYDVKPGNMIIDACTLANAAGLDFSIYDTDNDNILDNVFVYYAGFNEAENGPENTIWPHRWDITSSGYSGNKVFDGKTVNDYACTSELKGSTGSAMCGIGTFAHEFGHVLGLPDYYHTEDPEKNTLNEWHIMDYGAYLNEGRTPPVYTAYDRFYLGWVVPQQINSPLDMTLLPLYQGKTIPANTNQQAYLFAASNHNMSATSPSPSEFFMVEYRKQTGWDAFLPGEGMLIWHIDYNQSEWNNNSPNNYTGTDQTPTDHMRFYLQPLVGNTSTPGDAFTSGSFNPTTWSGTNINRPITAINKTSDNVTFKFMGGTQGPSISILGSLSPFKGNIGSTTTAQNLTVSGTALTGNLDIVLNENANFEIKLSTETTWTNSISIAPGSGTVNVLLNVRFKPLTAGNKTNQIIFSSAAATVVNVSLSGTAIDPTAPVVDFGKIGSNLVFPITKVNSTKSKTLNIKTTDVINDLSVTLSGANANLFGVSTNSITKTAANSENGINITVNYTPTSTGSHSAILTISGGGLSPEKVINLSGQGQ